MKRLVTAFALALLAAVCVSAAPGIAAAQGAVPPLPPAPPPDAAPPAATAPTLPPRPLHASVSGPPEPPAAAAPFYNWGIGWDAGRGFVAPGIAIRRRVDEAWGLGLIVDTNISGGDDESEDRSGDRSDDYTRNRETQVTSDFTSDAFGLRGFAFHESQLTDWFSLGPYFGIGYGFDRRDTDELRVSTSVSDASISVERLETTSTRTRHSWAFTTGVRPAFTFDGRFILETRLGLTATWRDGETKTSRYETDTTRDGNGAIQSSSSVRVERDDDDGWTLSAFGQELGPGAVLSFIVCF